MIGVLGQAALADPPEYRMAWVFGFGSEFANPTATSIMIDKLADNNFNVVVPEIRKYGDAYYNSAYEPWATDVQAGYDPLRDMLDKAHARDMEVWGWIVTYRIWRRNVTPPEGHMWDLHPEWACINQTGLNYSGSYHNLDPGIPGVQQYVCDIVKDVVTKYPDLDGFNFDYIRYDNYTWGYNPISIDRFRAEYGYDPPLGYDLEDPEWLAWNEWKRRQVTDLVKKCYLEANYINPQVKMTVDTIGWMGGDPNVDFTGTQAYSNVCQDHKGWMEDHIIDVDILMNYKRDWCTDAEPCWGTYCGGDQQSDHRLWSDWLASAQTSTGVHTIDGIGGYMNVLPGILAQWDHSRANGIGLGVYRYGFTIGEEDSEHPGKPVFSSGTTVAHGDDELFYDTIKTTMFPNPASIPDMPWKSAPTTGIIFGTVKDTVKPTDPVYESWIYQAEVTVDGPVTRVTTTDATGTYGFIGLPPGTYSLTISKTGYAERTYGYVALVAGQVLRRDCDLGYYACLLPADAKARPDESMVELIGGVVSAVFPDCFYVEAPNRSSGIRVEKADHGLSVWMAVDVSGSVKSNADGERYIEADAVNPDGTGYVGVLALLNRSLGGSDCPGQPGPKGGKGLSNIGLFIRTSGTVTHAESDFFYIDDGSLLRDSSGYIGVRVLPCGLDVPDEGSHVIVTGASSCFKDGDDLYRMVRATRILPGD